VVDFLPKAAGAAAAAAALPRIGRAVGASRQAAPDVERGSFDFSPKLIAAARQLADQHNVPNLAFDTADALRMRGPRHFLNTPMGSSTRCSPATWNTRRNTGAARQAEALCKPGTIVLTAVWPVESYSYNEALDPNCTPTPICAPFRARTSRRSSRKESLQIDYKFGQSAVARPAGLVLSTPGRYKQTGR
jgi:hypothetical protein